MRLDIGNFQVKRVMFGPATQYRDGVLTINKEEAAAVVNPNGKLKHVELHIACPGESCRILPIKAAVEPRARPDGRAAWVALMSSRPSTVRLFRGAPALL